MVGILLDTHTLYWLVSDNEDLSDGALIVIGDNQAAGTVFVSPITAWELSVATQKGQVAGRPNLGSVQPERWFRGAVRQAQARVIPIRQKIACEAAKVASDTGHKDPGDCFLIATARIRRVPIVTRDGVMRSIAAKHPDYLTVIHC